MSYARQQFLTLNGVLIFVVSIAIVGNLITGFVPVRVWLFILFVAAVMLNLGLWFGHDAALRDHGLRGDDDE